MKPLRKRIENSKHKRRPQGRLFYCCVALQDVVERCGDLRAHGVGTGDIKGFDAQVLLDRFEEQFDLPAAMIQMCDGQRGHGEVVGQNPKSSSSNRSSSLIYSDDNVESSDAVLAEVNIKRCAGNRDGIFESGRFPLAWISGST